MPAAMGIYWIANSVFGIIRDYVLTMKYKKQLDIEDAEKAAIRAEREKRSLRQSALRPNASEPRARPRSTPTPARRSSRKREAEERGAQGRS
ncbi:MAG: hypothetical protein V8S87_04930 [Oscillospiraceae bacterium]